MRSRLPGDVIAFPYGTKALKKLFIDQKIPASERPQIPVLADEEGLLGVAGFGADCHRTGDAPLVEITIEPF